MGSPKPPRPPAKAKSRLHVLLARESTIAVVLRRGPSKRVLAVRWDRRDDSFRAGQWFNGRIYEHRCDLSPSGEHLIYFAASFREPYYSWTAVSRPPFLTALALWPKGDCWGGGGQFISARRIALNHRPGEMTLAADSRIPKGYRVEPFGSHPGWGEDSPISDATLERDGWRLLQKGRMKEDSSRSAAMHWGFDPPQVMGKDNPMNKNMVLHSRLLGIGSRGGPWYLREAAVAIGAQMLELGPSDWVDWDANGDLLHAQDGRIYRRAFSKRGLGRPVLLFDGTELAFRPLVALPEALTWHEGLRRDAGTPVESP